MLFIRSGKKEEAIHTIRRSVNVAHIDQKNATIPLPIFTREIVKDEK